MPCWARCLGDCGGPITGEHYVSEGLWSGPLVDVVGFKWCKTEPRTIPAPRLTSNILCKHHNERLSPIDAAGIQAFRVMRTAQDLVSARDKLPDQELMPVWYGIDGLGLERWFLKTVVNIFSMEHDEARWQLTGESGQPPELLVRMAYGLEPISEPFGLYSVTQLGRSLKFDDGVHFAPLWTSEDKISGAACSFRGFDFILNLVPVKPPFIEESTTRIVSGELFYHLTRINLNTRFNRRGALVDLRWPDKGFDFFID